ncbi:MAG: hydroxymethylpyrimidine/phosphomethylpyrimidine kinase [Bacteroidetes bacterium]|nr:hydroxymethylpyrimidine/phosphomethylpyrimidine kinase [Bacteroidota bacterium]
MNTERANVLVVAGYDQSAGAGVLSDIKTLEAHGVYGWAVCTGFTFQNEHTISRVQWFSQKEAFEQIDLCFASRPFDWVKMGITESLSSAGEIIRHLRQHNPNVKVVLDPVIRASSGYSFWGGHDQWEEVAAGCYLLTPNWEEIGWLYPGEDVMERCRLLTRDAGNGLYLKGGHHPELPGRDYLWSKGELQVLDAMATEVYPKHGSGCVLSSALAANLALGYSLPEAAVYSKRYIERFLTSNKTLLGWHH